MENQKRIEKNISLSYVYNFLMYFRVTNAIWVLYLGFKGMSLAQIGLLESIFHITSSTCEIPTGALADIYGRKFSIMLGRMCSIIGAIIMMTSGSFLGFAIAFVFDGLSYTLNSGAAESLLFDSVKQINKEDDYKRISGSVNFVLEIGQIGSVLLGGYLSDIRFIYAYIASLFIQTLALIVSSQFTEPQLREVSEKKESFIYQIKQSLIVLKESPTVFYLIIFISVVSSIGTTVFFYCQKYFEAMDLSKLTISLIFAADSGIMAISSKFAYRIEEKLGQKGVIMLLPVLDLICLVGVGTTHGLYAIGFFYIISFVDGFSYPVFSHYINSLIPSERRATILSCESVSFSICMITIFPAVGFIGGKYGLASAFICLSVLFVPAVIFISRKLKNTNNTISGIK
jgi:MFS family permease